MPGCVRVTACLLGESNSRGSIKSFGFPSTVTTALLHLQCLSRGCGEGFLHGAAGWKDEEEGRPGEERHGKF